MSEAAISMVPKDHILDVWPKIAAYIQKAVKYCGGKYESEDMLDLLLDYDYPLWIAFYGPEIKGVVITNFIQYPRKKYLHVQAVAGVDMKSWKRPMLETLRKWARDNHCDDIEGIGRAGWERSLKDEGFTPRTRTFGLSLGIEHG